VKLPPYPKYKRTAIEALSVLPQGWQVMRGRFCMRVNPPSPRLRALDLADEISFIPMEAVGEYGGLDTEQTKPLGEISGSYTEFEDGDVVVAKITPCFENGKGALAQNLTNGAALGTTELHVLRASDSLDRRFLFYLTISSFYREAGEAEMYGAGGQKRVPSEFNKDFRTPLPPTDEQRAIADFLDRETAKLDTLVGKKRELIEKLKEKRSALISRTVTRGLPAEAAAKAGLKPHLKLKPSGIEWLGDIPENWEVTKMRRVCSSIRDGTHNPPDRAAGIHRLLSVRNVQNGKFFLLEDDRTMTPEDFADLQRSYSVEEGDIVLAIVGATTGKSAIVEKLENVTVQRSLAILRPIRSLISTTFLNYVIRSAIVQTEISLTVYKYSAQPGIYLDDVSQLPVVRPSCDEQTAIANYLDRETAKIAKMMEKVEAASEKLQEYRTALITAAVTGKIDVRAVDR
jgi:type I restriction enzyme S subunit